MIRQIALVLSVAFAVSPAFAQQQPVATERIAAQIGNLYIQVQQQQDTIAMLQADLTKAQARIKELEPKPEAKKD